MLLAADIGNSNIVIGGIFQNEVRFTARLTTDKNTTADMLAISLKNILSLYNLSDKDFDGAIISSVVPPVTQTMKNAISTVIGVTPVVIAPGIKTGLNIVIDNPAQTGSDMVADNVAAYSEYKKAVVVIDMGTATVISVTDKNGNFRGGSIHPGVTTSLNALSQNTAQLPFIDIEKPKKVVGTNSIDCMRSGIVYGTASMIDGMLERIRTETGYDFVCVATGGHARHIIPHCKEKILYDENLLLKGLNIIYNLNK